MTPAHVRWLSLIRYQASVADELIRQPTPLAMLAINTLHDAVESLLVLAIEVRTLTPPDRKPTFMQLFDTVSKDVPGTLAAHRRNVDNLNDARVNFKHHGVALDQSSIDRLHVAARAFLADASRAAPGQDFDSISLARLIPEPSVRQAAEDAEVKWGAGDQHGAMLGLRQAFNLLVSAYERAYSSGSRSPFTARPPGGVAVDAQRMRTMAEFGALGVAGDNHNDRWLRNLDDRVRLLALGVDLNRYTFLDVHAPVREYSSDIDGESTGFTQDVFDRCHRFVVDTALKLVEVRRGVPAAP